jgi:hypothetical protein
MEPSISKIVFWKGTRCESSACVSKFSSDFLVFQQSFEDDGKEGKESPGGASGADNRCGSASERLAASAC